MAVPKLRFKEFKEDWEKIKLAKIVAIIKEKNDGANHPIMMLSAGKGFIHQKEKYSKDNTGSSLKKYILLRRGDLAYNRGNSKLRKYGCIFELEKLSALVPYVYHCFRMKNDNSTFFGKYLNSGKIDKTLRGIISSSARIDGLLNVSEKDFFNIFVSKPTLSEQQKIADFLTIFDKRIAAQQNIIADLEETKKGLLQKIFSQEIRFKDDNGQDYPDWKKGKLSEIADFLQGLTYHPEDAVNTGKVVLRSSNIRNGQICYKDVVCVDMEIPDKLTLRENDVLMCVRNGSKKLVGKTAIITKGDLGNTWGAFMMILRAKENAGFLFQYINSKYFFKEMFVDLGTATINQITKGMLQKCKMMIPSSAEQQKIADFLLTFDKKITAERQILSDLKEMKKGLLQQMFV